MKKHRLIVVALLLAAAYALWPTARQSLPGLPAKPAEKTVYYKWQDDKGVWNLSDQPPEGVEAQQGVVNPNTNIIQSTAIAKPVTAQPATTERSEVTLPGLQYVERAGKVLEDARQASDVLNARQQQLDALSPER